MQYDAAGNVTKIVDGVNSETVDYTYDDLDRLLTASVPTGESFAYDTIGNMTAKAGTALDYGTASPKHAVKSHGSTAYTYDANGSMTARGTQTIKYDPEQRPILVQDGSNYSRAAYDGDGVRRKRDDSNGTVHYLGGYERKLAAGANSPETVTKYYSASLGAMSRPVAFRRGGTLHWVGADHLGGTIRVLDSGFTALDGMRYKPYGEDRDTGSSLNTDRKFTGQTEDETAGLYWYASRAYDPAIGRFVSPDAIVPDPSNPQSLNRYAYVYNNPLGLVDPSGNSPEWFNQAWRDEFRAAHKRDPGEGDIAYRRASMESTSRGQYWSDKYWVSSNYGTTPAPAPAPAPKIQDHKANLAENYNPTIVLADQAREAHLAENYNPTIKPRNPVSSEPDFVQSVIDNLELGKPLLSDSAGVAYTTARHDFEKNVLKILRDMPEEAALVTRAVRRVAIPVALVSDAAEGGIGEYGRGSSPGRALAVGVGSAGFGLIGGIAGGFIGSSVPVAGTVVGAAAGAYIGSKFGSSVTRSALDLLRVH